MTNISSFIMPTVVIGIILFGLFKRINVFDCFIEGAKEGLDMIIRLLPTLVGLIVAVTMLSKSGALDVLTWALSPISKVTGIPKEVMPLAVLSPISGSGSLAVFQNILHQHGADSLVGRVSSVIMGSTETTFYAVAVYYGSVGINKTRHTIPSALIADFTSFVVSSITIKFFFY